MTWTAFAILAMFLLSTEIRAGQLKKHSIWCIILTWPPWQADCWMDNLRSHHSHSLASFLFPTNPQKTPSIFFELSFFVCLSSSFSVRAIKDIKLIPALLPLVNAGFTKSAEIQNVDCYISPNRTFTINSIGEFVFVCLWSDVVLLAFKRSVFPDKCGWEGLC